MSKVQESRYWVQADTYEDGVWMPSKYTSFLSGERRGQKVTTLEDAAVLAQMLTNDPNVENVEIVTSQDRNHGVAMPASARYAF